MSVSFDSGFTVVTGATGAGKSIVLGALDLVLGKRADSKVAKNPDKKCVIEAHFDVRAYHLEELFKALDLDYDPMTILRRELLPSGKSRAFVNDALASLSQVQQLSECLVEIHHQGDTHRLGQEAYQFDLLDALSGQQKAHGDYKKTYQYFLTNQKTISDLISAQQRALQELDYQQFMLQELVDASLDGMDQVNMEEAQSRLKHQELIQEVLEESWQHLSNDDIGLVDQLNTLQQRLGRLASIGGDFHALYQRIESVRIELSDIRDEIDDQRDRLDTDPSSLQDIEETLNGLYRLQTKHGVVSIADLVEIRDELSEKIANASTIDQRIGLLEAEQVSLKKALENQATELHEKRLLAIPKFEKMVNHYLSQLALGDAQWQLRLTRVEELNYYGGAQLSLWFSANKGIAPQPIHLAVSGGEMSRVVLAVKAVLAEFKALPTLIFDEIDTGISGEIASKMADILRDMSDRGQLFCMTHLPQTAAKGRFHKRIFKESDGEKTRTYIKDLDPQERIQEIAQMIGGRELTDSAKAHARQLLN